MIDYESLNILIYIACTLGVLLIVIIFIVGLIMFVYYLAKINDSLDKNFIKRVKKVIHEDKD